MPYPSADWKKKFGDYKAAPVPIPDVTNKAFAGGSTEFQKACSLAGVSPTPCQAKKFRKRTGKAYKAMKEAEQSAPVS